MACTITSDKIEILMNNKDLTNRAPLTGYRSALQNPDLSRVQLAALLRRNDRPGERRKRKNLWSSFTDNQLGQHANSNG